MESACLIRSCREEGHNHEIRDLTLTRQGQIEVRRELHERFTQIHMEQEHPESEIRCAILFEIANVEMELHKEEEAVLLKISERRRQEAERRREFQPKISDIELLLQRLPQEVKMMIFDATPIPALAVLNRTSQLLRSLTTRHLYSRPKTLRTRLFARTLYENPDLAKCVISLSFISRRYRGEPCI
ncbi:hypothetical protein B0T14DRAFT_126577 [Immersiella caudata]|uniref:F-box domain-containing protein n=1 Tax=Immersiella caudata TaxID=314043 RepID=A0AA40C7I6_9PEZI|nr:hypothetical protein B0T14DRAFT_126577 [Immersiella caudata]